MIVGVGGGWTQLFKQELHNLCFSRNHDFTSDQTKEAENGCIGITHGNMRNAEELWSEYLKGRTT
jgi:hypothetical protein